MNGRLSDLSRRLVVVGGGISGLAVAYRLQEKSQRLPFG
jgi:protoporphyrinogen oxidase